MARDEDFIDLAEQVTSGLYRRALLVTRDAQLAEDLTQETLTRLYVRFDRVDARQNPRGYAHKILYRLMVDRSRRQAARELPSESVPELAHATPDAELRLDLERALDDLSPEVRALVVARYVDDLSVREAAAVFRRTETWVSTTTSRALASLRTNPALVPTHP